MKRFTIVTKQNKDGTYDEVGMNSRRVVHLKTERGIIKRCLRQQFIKLGDKLRIEWFHEPCIASLPPYATTYVLVVPSN